MEAELFYEVKDRLLWNGMLRAMNIGGIEHIVFAIKAGWETLGPLRVSVAGLEFISGTAYVN